MNQDSEGANMEGHENPENGKLFCGALHAQLSYSSTTHSELRNIYILTNHQLPFGL